MCTHCGQRFVYSSNLARHTQLHTSSPTERSFKCGEWLNGSASLNQHFQEIKPHSCQQCGKCFTMKSSLTRHLKLHGGDKSSGEKCSGNGTGPLKDRPYVCEQCSESFAVESSLTRHHLKIHYRDKPLNEKCSGGPPTYICEHCSKIFAVKSSLVRHLKVHSGEKPKHKQCPNDGRSPGKYQGGKPFVCVQCGNCFAVKSSLTRHLKIHSGEKPYKCKHCNKCFTYNTNLKAHTLIHSRGRYYGLA